MHKFFEDRRYAVYIIEIAVICVLAWIISNNWYQVMLIQGNSMEPAYHNLQFVILKKSFESSDIDSGDVIAFECKGLDSVLVKRVVAVPGDIAYIENGILYVNDLPSTLYNEGEFDYQGLLVDEVVLKNGQYIVIGDNTSESKDSRHNEVGIVEYEDIIGIVIPQLPVESSTQ